MTEFSGVHGTPMQRYYNVRCIAYVPTTNIFGFVVDKGYLPKERAEGV